MQKHRVLLTNRHECANNNSAYLWQATELHSTGDNIKRCGACTEQLGDQARCTNASGQMLQNQKGSQQIKCTKVQQGKTREWGCVNGMGADAMCGADVWRR